jgi:hypothetical protein
MNLYDTELECADAPCRKDARSVDAWIRAAAYAAGADPEAVLAESRPADPKEHLALSADGYERDAVTLCDGSGPLASGAGF